MTLLLLWIIGFQFTCGLSIDPKKERKLILLAWLLWPLLLGAYLSEQRAPGGA